MRGILATTAIVLAAGAVLAGVTYYVYAIAEHSVEGWDHYVPQSQDEGPMELAVKSAFLSSDMAPRRYEELFRYFAAGAVKYASPLGARIQYPGAGSIYGYRVNGLEGFARTAPLLAAWVASGRGDLVINDHRVDLVEFLRRGLLAGTDPASEEYWGDIRAFDQRIVEAADIARILWMTRNEIWHDLGESDRNRIADWLMPATRADTRNNNWLLFPVTVGVALRALGVQVEDDGARRYDRFKTHYLGNGWFYDSPGKVDYYNTWSITYELFWITTIDGQFDRDFIRRVIGESAELTAHLIGPSGIPIMGSSICYRTAVPVPLIAHELLEPDRAAAGLARRALDAVWRYFVGHGSLRDGALTQGYTRTDLRLLDGYSGPGS